MNLIGSIAKVGYLGLQKQDFREVGRRSITAAGMLWHRRFKMLRFQLFAFGRYHLRKRTPAYEAHKRREHPEAEGRPLVFSGDSEQRAAAADRVTATARSWQQYHADVHIDAPTLNYHADEATRLIETERRAMETEFQLTFLQQTHRIAGEKSGRIPLGKAG